MDPIQRSVLTAIRLAEYDAVENFNPRRASGVEELRAAVDQLPIDLNSRKALNLLADGLVVPRTGDQIELCMEVTADVDDKLESEIVSAEVFSTPTSG